jgi:N-acetyl-gamma-glutamyl-phosphate reductase
MSTPIGIVGFRGYSGAEAIGILSRHPEFEPVLLEHRQDAGDGHKLIRKSGPRRIAATADAARAAGIQAVLLATPPEVSMDVTPSFLDAGIKVVDLSGAFRLRTAATYKHWYKEEHTAAQLFDEAVYGLPEYNREQVRGARLVSNPGCYPTAANLALRPLTAANVIDRNAGVVCDAKSGVSGAGRKASLKTSFCEVTGNFSAYSILRHRHVPEVLMTSGLEESEFSFTAQLIPIDRGILETIYFRLADKSMTAADVLAIYQQQYADEPFVRLYEAPGVPDLHAVAHTNFCDIGVVVDTGTGRCVIVSAIDNLGKGAAGQAIQNLNLMMGFPETQGLL